jgi:hypothetical protein
MVMVSYKPPSGTSERNASIVVARGLACVLSQISRNTMEVSSRKSQALEFPADGTYGPSDGNMSGEFFLT